MNRFDRLNLRQSPAVMESQVASPATTAIDPDTLALVRDKLFRGVEYLLSQQSTEGYWCAELEGDSILQSEYILLRWIINRENDPRLKKIADYLRTQQREDGAWVQYPGAKIDISATVKGYFALKLSGDDVNAPHMQKARQQILQHGGAEKVNSFTKFYLAALGQISYSAVPSIPPELVYLPRWFYFHMDKVSAWTRTMIMPLAIVTSHRPVRQLPSELGIDELYKSPADRHRLLPNGTSYHPTWTRFFLLVDKILKLVHKFGMTPVRKRALQRMEKWILDRTEHSDGLGAIFPPMVYILIALRCRGYAPDHPKLIEAEKHLDDLMIHDEATGMIRIQPCLSPMWDTGIAAYALTDAGLNASSPAMRKCAQWLISKECKIAGDWVNNIPARDRVQPSGWFFEFNNAFYPDVDDTVMVAMALRGIGGPEAVEAAARGVAWIMPMQNTDGGWAAFDKGTQDRPILEYVPFADHNAIQDPSCPDITGRTLECLGHHGYKADHPAVAKAIAYIRSKQFDEGCWFGRWGVNYIYGTWQVVGGLRSVGFDMTTPWVQKAGAWLRQVQKADGSFGESADTYEDPSTKGQGPSTASQTAWGTMALMAIYGPGDPDVQRGIRWLCETQQHNGNWHEPEFTGTGFPRVFYLRYHLYRTYFPIMAIGRWQRLAHEQGLI